MKIGGHPFSRAVEIYLMDSSSDLLEWTGEKCNRVLFVGLNHGERNRKS